jgi:hypothetical protein
MKKTLIVALAGIMMFAFTQCGGGGSVSGSKEYQDNMKMYKEVEKTIKNAKTCDELSDAIMSMLLMGLADNNEYADNEKMTEAEKAELEKFGESFEELFQKQSEKLGCEEDDFKLF